MLFDYYMKITSNEHMLYASEISELYGIQSSTGRPHHSLVKTVIVDYMKSNNIEYIPLFYETKNGLREVFSKEHYEPAMSQLIASNEQKYTSLSKKTYYFNRINKRRDDNYVTFNNL